MVLAFAGDSTMTSLVMARQRSDAVPAAQSSAGDVSWAAVAGNPRPSVLYLLIGGLSWPVLRVVFRLRVTGAAHLPRDGAYVLSANHWSNFDPWPLAMPLFPRRFLRFMAKAELFWFPLGLVISGGGGFKVRRGEGDQEAIETAIRLCREGHVVVMFPEGTRREKGLRKTARGAVAHRCGADRARGGCPARAGGHLGHGRGSRGLHGCGSPTARRSSSTILPRCRPATSPPSRRIGCARRSSSLEESLR